MRQMCKTFLPNEYTILQDSERKVDAPNLSGIRAVFATNN
jgi:hypothetical protein